MKARNQSVAANVAGNSREQTTQKPKKPAGIWNFLDEDEGEIEIEASNKNLTLCDAAVIVRNYLERPRIPLENDPLKYWNSSDLTTELRDIMLRNLCVPGSSVPVEELFSNTGYIVSDRRTRLVPQHVQMMAFLKANYHYFNNMEV